MPTYSFRVKGSKIYETEEGEDIRTFDLWYSVKMKGKDTQKNRHMAKRIVIQKLMEKGIVAEEIKLVKVK